MKLGDLTPAMSRDRENRLLGELLYTQQVLHDALSMVKSLGGILITTDDQRYTDVGGMVELIANAIRHYSK